MRTNSPSPLPRRTPPTKGNPPFLVMDHAPQPAAQRPATVRRAALPADLPILAQVTLAERLGPFHWQAQLPNGAPVTPFLERDEPARPADELRPGSVVTLALSPFDFSQGRIVA